MTGEAESSALLKEINKQKGIRPLTHDLTKHLLQAAGFRVTKIRITELVSSSLSLPRPCPMPNDQITA